MFMKKLLALFLSGMLLALTACSAGTESTQTGETHSAPLDDSAYVFQPSQDAVALPGGATVAFASDSEDLESGAEGMLWKGIQTFAGNFGYTAQSYAVSGASTAEDALREAAQSGATLVVCRGEAMARALYAIQDNYPGVLYLLFDDEPHNEEFTVYKSAASVHCVLFREEQIGYLAGYASVMEGYTTLGFIGADETPDVVRYCTGMLQGAEAAAEQQGEEVNLRVWYTGNLEDPSLVTTRATEWYNTGTGLILANGEEIIQGVVDAANQTGGRVFATDWDWNDAGERVLGSAIKCYNAAVQKQLYDFFSNNSTWGQEDAGQTEKIGYTDGSVALAGAVWRFNNFSQRDYDLLYEDLRNSVLKVDAYADMDTLPDTPSVILEVQN